MPAGVCREPVCGEPDPNFLNCDEDYKKAFIDWVKQMYSKLGSTDSNWSQVPEDVRKCLVNQIIMIWNSQLRIECVSKLPKKAYAEMGSDGVRISAEGFTQGGPGLVLHELIHACKGTQLDAYAVSHLAYDEGGGAALPTDKAYKEFKSLPKINGRYSGTYIEWNPKTGELWLKADGKKLQKNGKDLIFKP